MFIYLLKSEDNGYYKIGKTINPEKRIKSLQTGNPEKIIIISKVNVESRFSSKIETAMHSQYSYAHKNGEWFDLDINDEVLFESNVKKIENNLLILEIEGNHFV